MQQAQAKQGKSSTAKDVKEKIEKKGGPMKKMGKVFDFFIRIRTLIKMRIGVDYELGLALDLNQS